MAIEITTTKEATKYKKFIIYGSSGIGKTTLVKDLPNVLLLTSENKSEPLAHLEIPCWKIETIDDFEDSIKKILKKEYKKHDWVAIDSLTDIHASAVHAEKPNHKHEMKAYGVVQDRLVEIIKTIRDSNKVNFYIICRDKMIVNDEGYDTFYPKMSGQQLHSEIASYFAYVFPMRLHKGDENSYRYFQTNMEHDSKYICKGSDALEHMEKPDLNYILEKIRTSDLEKGGEKKKKKKKKKQ